MNDLKSAEYSPVPALVGNAVGVGVPLRVRVPQLAAAGGKRARRRIRQGAADIVWAT